MWVTKPVPITFENLLKICKAANSAVNQQSTVHQHKQVIAQKVCIQLARLKKTISTWNNSLIQALNGRLFYDAR